jgi:WD40 repeat protein
VATLYGPCLSADAIDICEGKVVTGSHRGKDPL